MKIKEPLKLSAILLNLTGLGLGYLVLRQWARWRAYITITLGLFILAVLTKAYQTPGLWLILVASLLTLSAIDAWKLSWQLPNLQADWFLILLAIMIGCFSFGSMIDHNRVIECPPRPRRRR